MRIARPSRTGLCRETGPTVEDIALVQDGALAAAGRENGKSLNLTRSAGHRNPLFRY
jgi:hypothetical protein